MTARRPLQSLQAGRGLAALSVVLFHADAVFALPKYWGERLFGHFLQPANSGVYYFFVLSGFIITYAHASDIGRPDRLQRYAMNRAQRIYPLYWIVTGLAVVFLALAHMLQPQETRAAFIVGDISLLPFDGDRGTLAVAWTLFHEIVFYLLFSLLIVSRRIGIAAFFVWTAGCIVGCAHLHGLPADTGGTFAGVLFAPINLLFIFGLAAFAMIDYSLLRHAGTLLTVGCTLFVGTWIWEALYLQYWGSARAIMAFGVGAALIVAALCEFELSGRLRIPLALALLGDASYSIYLVHFLAISAAAKVVSRWHEVLPGPAAFFLLVLAGVMGGLAAHFAIERPIMELWRRGSRHLAS